MSRSRRPARHSPRGHRSRARALAAGSGLAVVATVLSGSVTEAATHPTVTVTSLRDGKAAAGKVRHGRAPTLADAIAFLDKQPTGGTITFASKLSGTVALTHTLPVVSKPIDIRGPGESRLRIKNTVKRKPAIEVKAHGTTEISGMTITGGRESGILALSELKVTDVKLTGNSNFYSGGGIDAPGGAVAVYNSTITGNVSTRKRGGGGGIYLGHRGELLVRDSTVADNRAPYGAGIDVFGDVLTVIEGSTVSGNSAKANVGAIDLIGYSKTHGPTGLIVNSTIADNHASHAIGGIYVGDYGKGGPSALTVISSTIAGNAAQAGRAGGIEVYGSDLELLDSILAGNSDRAAGANASPDLAIGGKGGTQLASFSLIGDGTDTIRRTLSSNGTDIVGTGARRVNPGLEALGRHGGPTETMPLRRGSPARGRGSTRFTTHVGKHLNLKIDQRGRPRVGLSASPATTDGTDMGAVEVSQAVQTRSLTGGNQRFSITTASSTRVLAPAQGLPVVFHARRLAHRSPRLRFKQVTLRVSGERAVHRYTRANDRVLLPLTGLARGRHTLSATVSYRLPSGRLHSTRLRLQIRVG